MSSCVDMSLEDIIKRKKQTARTKHIKPKVQLPLKPNQITDARNKIISKNRTQITDARDKLAQLAKQKDARFKLEKLRLERAKLQGQTRTTFQNRGKFLRTSSNKERVFTDASRQVVSLPFHLNKAIQSRQLGLGKQFNIDRDLNDKSHIHIGRQVNIGRQLSTGKQTNTWRQHNTGRQIHNNKQLNSARFTADRSINKMRSFDFKNTQKPKPIVRTVQNDLEIIDDPMGEDFVLPKSSSQVSLNRQASLQLKIVTHNDDIHENRVATVYRSAITDKEKSPPRLPSILKKRPMAALKNDTKVQKPDKTTLEFRIIVSNLRNTVTAGDIEELFGDVGGMLESRLVRPGTAEVIYKTQEDAQRAVDLYHNRQLDGQPMNCLLVTPRSPTAVTRNSSKPALYSTNSNVEPDISTFHKVLFSNL